MNAAAIICVTLAVGVCGFLLYAGQALLAWANKPRQPKHQHEWEQVHSASLHHHGVGSAPTGLLFVLRCKSCGDISSRRV